MTKIWRSSSKDVNIQDQTSPPVEYFLTHKIADVQIAANVSLESHYIDLVSGHGFTVNEFIEIKYNDGLNRPRHFQAIVAAVNVDQITVMPSLDFDLDTAFVVSAKRCDADFSNYPAATVDNPVEFDLSPVDGLSYDLTAITVGMILGTQPDDGLFGNIPKLPFGIYFGFKVFDGITESNVFHNANVQDNSDFRAYCGPQNVQYTVRSGGGGDFGLSAEKKFTGMDNYGVAVRMTGNNQYFYVSLHDDVSGIDRLRMKVRGHIVEE